MSVNDAAANQVAFTPDGLETILVSADRQPTGRERIVLAFRDGDDLHIPLDTGRNVNQELLSASTLFVREPHSQDHCRFYSVSNREPISAANRSRLEHHAHRAISETTDVLHVTRRHTSIAELEQEPPGFIAVVDGSERALSAISPAIALSDWYGRCCTIVAATAGPDDSDTGHAVRCQLEGTRLSDEDLIQVTKVDLQGVLCEMMRQGHVIVAPAFGVWPLDGRLHGTLNDLVRHNAPILIGIGPHVASDWAPATDHPIIVCVDDSEHAHHLVAKLGPILTASRSRVLVVHIATPDSHGSTIADQVADAIQHRYGIPAEACTVDDDSPATAIVILAGRTQSQLVVTHSWHRPRPGAPRVCSTSLTAVAHAPCPVVILGE